MYIWKTELKYFFLTSSITEFGSEISDLTDYALSKYDNCNKIIIYDTFKELIYNGENMTAWMKLKLLANNEYKDYIRDLDILSDKAFKDAFELLKN